MLSRSIRAEVRNPLLQLPAAQRLAAESCPHCRELLEATLREIREDARARADKAWRTHKGPMALYWKCVAVYVNHLRRLVRGRSA